MSEEYHTLNPKAKTSMYIGNIVKGIIVTAVLGIIAVAAGQSDVPSYAQYAPIALIVVCWLYLILAPEVYYRHYKYCITSDKIDIRRGIIVLSHTVVPIERIHQVEVVRGPINNLFGLADITVTTAGGDAVIEYLDTDTADEIADKLNAIVNQILKGRKQDA